MERLTKRRWGRSFFEVQPGKHHVQISFGYLFTQRGKNFADVEVPAGKIVNIDYFMTPWIFARGRIRVS